MFDIMSTGTQKIYYKWFMIPFQIAGDQTRLNLNTESSYPIINEWSTDKQIESRTKLYMKKFHRSLTTEWQLIEGEQEMLTLWFNKNKNPKQ